MNASPPPTAQIIGMEVSPDRRYRTKSRSAPNEGRQDASAERIETRWRAERIETRWWAERIETRWQVAGVAEDRRRRAVDRGA
ncbi:MAG: hypothetical protein LBK66_09535 [Spirochaetaceae bacterium]|nr:hypothetical protein [Spirochaetaceae bacterium]